MSIFGEQAALQTEEVEFRGGKVTVHEMLDSDYFELVTLPTQDEELPDEDDREAVLRYNRAYNLRLVAAALTPSLDMEHDAILETLSKEPRQAVDKLLAATLRVNGMALVKNSPTTTSE